MYPLIAEERKRRPRARQRPYGAKHRRAVDALIRPFCEAKKQMGTVST